MPDPKTRILLIDQDDARRATRVRLVTELAYDVYTRENTTDADRLKDEGPYDLIIVALHDEPELTVAYSDELTINKPSLPILLLIDWGILVPPEH